MSASDGFQFGIDIKFTGMQGPEVIQFMRNYNKLAAQSIKANEASATSHKQLTEAMRIEREVQKDLASSTLKNVKESLKEDAARKRITQTIVAQTVSGKAYTAQLIHENGQIVSATRKLADLISKEEQAAAAKKKEEVATKKLAEARKRAQQAAADEARETSKQNRIAQTAAQIKRQLADGTIRNIKETKQYDAANDRLTRTYTGLNASGKKFTATLITQNGVLKNAKTRLRDADTEYDKLQRTVSRFQTLFASYTVGRGIYALVGSMQDSVRTAYELNLRLSEVQTIAQKLPISTEKWRKGLMEVSNVWGIDIIDQAEAAYQALSNQIGNSVEVLSFMNDVNEFAIVTNSSATDSVQLLTAAVNAWGLEAGDANEVAAQMFKTIELGRIRANELANSYGQIAPIAKLLNINMIELSATLEAMTIRGVKTDEAITLMRNIMNSLIKPTKEMAKFLDELGASSGEAAIATYGFANFLGMFEARVAGSSTEIGKMVRRLRAIAGSALLVGDGLDTVNANIAEHENAMLSYMRATELAMKEPAQVIRREINQLKNAFTDGLGTEAVEALALIDKHLFDISSAGKVAGTSLLYLGSAAVVYGLLSTSKAIAQINLALKGTAFTLGGVTAAVSAGIVIYTTLTEVMNDLELERRREEMLALRRASVEAANAAARQMVPAYKSLNNQFDILKQNAAYHVRNSSETLAKLETQGKTIKALMQNAINDVGKALTDQVNAANKAVKDYDTALEAITKTVNTAIKAASEAIRDIELSLLDNLEDRAAVVLGRIRETSKLITDAKTQKELTELSSAQLDNIKAAKTLLDEANRSNERLSQTVTKNLDKIRSLTEKIAETRAKITKLQRDTARTAGVTSRDGRPVGGATAEGRGAYADYLEKLRKHEQDIISFQNTRQKLLKENGALQKTNLTFDLQTIKALYQAYMDNVKRTGDELIRETERKRAEAKRLAEKAEAAQKKYTEATIELAKFDPNNQTEAELSEKIGKVAATINKVYADDETARRKALLRLYEYEAHLSKIYRAKSKAEKAKETQNELIAVEKKYREELDREKRALQARQVAATGYTKKLQDRILESMVGRNMFGAPIGRVSESEKARIRGLSFGDLQGLSREQQKALGITKDYTGTVEYQDALASYRALTNQENKITELKSGFDTLAKTLTDRIPDELRLRKAAEGGYEEDKKQTRLLKVIADLLAANDKVTLAAGGSVGSDRVHAMLTPGEYVVNAGAARKYKSQLSAINSGLQARNMGGPVTNLNGGINVTVNSTGDSKVDGAVIAKTIRREVRRRTLRV